MVKIWANLLAASLFATAAACGKKDEPPPSVEKAKAEKEAATKAVRDNPVVGEQFKALDKAKATADAAGKKREDAEAAPPDKLKEGY
jgi:hypothetical protein